MARKKNLPLIEDFNNIPKEALVPESEQPYPIPKHWKWVRLGTACMINPPKADISSVPKDTDVTFIPMAAVSDVTGKVGNTEVRKLEQVSKGYTSFSSEDVLFAKITPCMENGKAAVVPDLINGLGYGSTEFFVLRPSAALSTQFLHAFIRRETFRKQAKEVMAGAVGQQRVPKSFLEELAFPLPPLEEQRHIVEYIEQTNAKIDDVIQRLEQYLDEAPQKRTELIQAGVSGALTKNWREERELPEGSWLHATVGDLGAVVTGNTPPTKNPDNYGNHIPFIKPTDLNQGRHTKSADSNLSEVGARIARVIPPGSVAMCCIGATITKTGLIEVEAATNQQINVLIPSTDHDAVFLYYLFESPQFKSEVIASSSSTTLPIINKSRFSKLEAHLPGLNEQKEVARILDDALGHQEQITELVQQAIDKLQNIRSQIVQAAVAGLTLT